MFIAPNHCFHANFGGGPPNFRAFHDFIPENILGITAFLDMNCKYEVKKTRPQNSILPPWIPEHLEQFKSRL